MNPEPELESIELPSDVIEGLERLDKSMALLTPVADRRVAEAAKAHFAQRPQGTRPRPQVTRSRGGHPAPHHPALGDRTPPIARSRGARPVPRRWALGGALAASLLVGVFVARMQTGVEPAMLANDIDGSGAVDILDAFALARMDGEAARVPQAEIDALVMDIVALNGAGP